MKKIMLLFLSIITLFSCEKILFKEDLASTDPMTNFDYLWSEIDKKYSYFSLKKINWDSIKAIYRPMITPQMDEQALFDVLANMLNELRDDHSNLITPFDISRYDVSLKNELNFRFRTIEEHYVPNGKITGSFFHDILPTTNIAYLRYGSFMNGVANADLNFILDKYKDTDGLILDLRQNGGGSIVNIPQILERFSTEKTLVGHFITRNGPNHSDFSEKAAFYIGTYAGTKYSKPVCVLIDRGSYSATTMFALATKAFPNITLVGDTTGGGGGLPNGGQLPNGWIYRFSVSQLLDLQGNNFAEDGVAPDVVASFDWTDLTKDEILEQAISLLQ